jgi:tetratricopeptide (TPR) repeat protein
LQQDSGLSRAELARQVKCSRSQLYEILNGRVSRPPEWDRVVEPLVRACTRDDERAIARWRKRHGVLVQVHSELRRQPGGTSRPTQPDRVVPAQLPADVDVFTGRARELAALDLLVADDVEHPAVSSTAVVISAVSGTAGVGKTALAVRWAHRVRDKFPDGQLYVNLRGYDPGQPMSAGDALAGFLRALGLAGQDIPLEVDERAATYRSLLDGRRVLVVLDNATSVEQIRPLLPGTSSCLVLVTSRDSLAGLVARHGARRLDLDLLPPEDAVALLRVLIGERVEAEPEAAKTLAAQCAWLPLALRVAAELAAARPSTSLAALVAELGDQQRRLDLLDAGGDPRTAVSSVFSWSYQHLSAEAARAFRLLSLHPGPDLDSYAATALINTGRDRGQQLLDLLDRAHLIQPTSLGRYGMHDLLRAYANQLAATEDSEPERRAALTRLFDHYLATAAAAMDTRVPAERHHRPRIPAPATPGPPMSDPTAARAWLDAERATLATACAYTAAHGWPAHTTRLATTLFRYYDTGGYYADALSIHTHALRAARHTGDRSAEAHALTSLGVVYQQQGHNQQAGEHHQQALALSRAIGDRPGEGRALGNLGVVYARQGRFAQAAEYFQQALALFRAIGDRAGEARALGNLGGLYARQGRFEQAAEHHQQTLALARYIGHRPGEARALDNLGIFYAQQGGFQQAAEHHQQALVLARDAGDRVVEAAALDNLGIVYSRQGRHQEAAEQHQLALILFREIGDRGGEAKALNSFGETRLRMGQPQDAFIQHTAALTVATEIGDRYEQARAYSGLAHTYYSIDDPEQARDNWRQALTHYTDLALPEADNIRAALAALDQAQQGDSPG